MHSRKPWEHNVSRKSASDSLDSKFKRFMLKSSINIISLFPELAFTSNSLM